MDRFDRNTDVVLDLFTEAITSQKEPNPVQVFVFDLLPYAEPLDDLVHGTALPYPLGKSHFKPDVAVRTYAEHLEAWELMDRLGYDGVGFNEHHCSPYGLMNSPNLMAAVSVKLPWLNRVRLK